MTKASDNVYPRLLISEGGSTATPAANRVTVYAKSDGLLYSKDDAGAETPLGGSSGSVATDAIWDAAGDLAVGSGANTAAKLTKGNDNDVLTISASTHVPVWAPPTGGSDDPILDIFGAPDTAFEFDTSSFTGLTGCGTPAAEDADTTVPGHYYVADATASFDWCGRYAAKSAASPFTAIAKLSDFSHRVSYNQGGIFVGESTPGKILALVTGGAVSSRFAADIYTNPTTYGSSVVGLTEIPDWPRYFAIVANSTTDVDCWLSYNGRAWWKAKDAADPSMTIGSVGVGMKAENALGCAAAFDFLRIWNSAKTFPGI